MKRVLIVTYYWPPAGGPGVQRVLKFAKYLPEFGWEPIILTVKNGEYQAYDESLMKDTKGIKVFRTKTFELYGLYKKLIGLKGNMPTFHVSQKDSLSPFSKLLKIIRYHLIVPDGRIGWYNYAKRKGKKILKKYRIDTIVTSGPPNTVHLIGLRLSKNVTNWVADFRDPWIERFYLNKNRFFISQKIDMYFEKQVLRYATRIITVSETISQLLLKKKYVNKVYTITNGYDEEDFYLQIEKKVSRNLNIVYSGTMSEQQIPWTFLHCVRNINSQNENHRVKLTFYGSVHPSVKQLVSKYFDLDRFVSFNDYISHNLIVEKMVCADLLLLVIPNSNNNKGILTGKLFEYIRSGTPILLIGPEQSEAEGIIKSTSSGFCTNYDDEYKINKILKSDISINPSNFTKYERKYLTKKLSKYLSEVR